MDKKPGRNDPCYCGSGKKYKNCHLAEDSAKKTTYTESGKRKFKASVVSSGNSDQKSQNVFQAQPLSSPLQKREIKPLDLNRFRSSKTDYRTTAKEEALPFEVSHDEVKKPEQKSQEEKPELPEEFNPTKEDYRE